MTMRRTFAVRGIVEGFYGPPWTHAERLDAISFLAPRGLNAYVYAPKDDAKHRAEWRVPYDGEERARFRDLAAHADANGARFGFAISPGLDIDYESDADRAAVLAKLAPLLDAGVPWFLLLLDDIPMQPGLAPRHARMTQDITDASGHVAAGPAARVACRRGAHAVPDRVRRHPPVAVSR